MTLFSFGLIAGTPTSSGNFPITLTATDSNGCTGSHDYVLIITSFLFSDDFEDGVLAANWTYIKPAWTEQNGELTGTPTGKKAVAIASPVFAGCVVCTLETTMSSAGGQGNRIMLLGWYLDKQNKVELVMNEETDKWVLKQRSAGVVVGKAKFKQPIDPNVNYGIKISFDGAKFDVYVNDVLIISLSAVGSPNGTMGLEVKNTIGKFLFVLIS